MRATLGEPYFTSSAGLQTAAEAVNGAGNTKVLNRPESPDFLTGGSPLSDASMDCVVIREPGRVPDHCCLGMVREVDRVLKPNAFAVLAVVGEDKSFETAVAALLNPYSLGSPTPRTVLPAFRAVVTAFEEAGYKAQAGKEVRATVTATLSEALQRGVALRFWQDVATSEMDIARRALEEWLKDQAAGDAVELQTILQLTVLQKPFSQRGSQEGPQ